MRRSEKEITSFDEIAFLVGQSLYAIVSMIDGDSPYAVPLNVSWDGEFFYAHCAHEGKKLDVLRKNPNIQLTFVPEAEYFRRKENVACGSTMHYRTVLVSGTAEVLGADGDADIRMRGFTSIADHFNVGQFPFLPEAVAKTTLIRITPGTISGKRSPA